MATSGLWNSDEDEWGRDEDSSESSDSNQEQVRNTSFDLSHYRSIATELQLQIHVSTCCEVPL